MSTRILASGIAESIHHTTPRIVTRRRPVRARPVLAMTGWFIVIGLALSLLASFAR